MNREMVPFFEREEMVEELQSAVGVYDWDRAENIIEQIADRQTEVAELPASIIYEQDESPLVIAAHAAAEQEEVDFQEEMASSKRVADWKAQNLDVGVEQAKWDEAERVRAEEEERAAREAVERAAAAAEEERREATAAEAAEWEEMDDGQGGIFYYHAELEESVWEKPQCVLDNEADVRWAEEQAGEGMIVDAEGYEWELMEDDEGNTFYYNAATEESKWSQEEIDR
jgi:hypothetical protein